MELKLRETVILVEDFDAIIKWYCDVLGFSIITRFDDAFHYCNLVNDAGVKLGIALASEMQIKPEDRTKNTIILQFEVEDVKALFVHVETHGGSITGEASYSKKDDFWFGSFADPEGNSHWVVDSNCP